MNQSDSDWLDRKREEAEKHKKNCGCEANQEKEYERFLRIIGEYQNTKLSCPCCGETLESSAPRCDKCHGYCCDCCKADPPTGDEVEETIKKIVRFTHNHQWDDGLEMFLRELVSLARGEKAL